ncbi:GNAT family N-acetyltransferase [Micromonospora sonchi]|nr:GNAT family N-acetyltransferase [Micromonospora sonchi]
MMRITLREEVQIDRDVLVWLHKQSRNVFLTVLTSRWAGICIRRRAQRVRHRGRFRAVVEREFATGTPLIYAVVDPGNTASIAVARRLGMTSVGRRSGWYGGEELETFVLTRPA